MRILYLHQYFTTPEMSGGTRSYEMARRLVSMGHEVHMITSWREPGEKRGWFRSEVEGVQVHWLPVAYSNEMRFKARIKAFFKFAFFAARKAASIEADLVFATSTPLTISLPAVYASRKQKIPMVFEVRDLWPELPIAMNALKSPVTRFLARRLERFSYQHASAIVALSPGMKAGVVKTGYPEKQVAVLPNSADIALFQVGRKCGEEFRSQRDWLSERPLLIYTGTFGLINGVGYMVDLAKRLLVVSPDIRILLIGDGIEYEKVMAEAKQAGVLNQNLFIEPSIPKQNVPAALNAATVVCSLFIDKKEMQPNSANKFFDALAAGKPVMINYGGWQKDLIEATGAGVVTWKLDTEQAVEKMVEAVENPPFLKKAGEASYNLALELFDREILAEQLEQVLVSVAEGHPDKASSIASGNFKDRIKVSQ